MTRFQGADPPGQIRKICARAAVRQVYPPGVNNRRSACFQARKAPLSRSQWVAVTAGLARTGSPAHTADCRQRPQPPSGAAPHPQRPPSRFHPSRTRRGGFGRVPPPSSHHRGAVLNHSRPTARKRSVTAGQRGGNCKIGSRSLPDPETGRAQQPTLITKSGCDVQLSGRGGRI